MVHILKINVRGWGGLEYIYFYIIFQVMYVGGVVYGVIEKAC